MTEQEVYRRWSDATWVVDETSLGPTKELIYLATPQDLRSLEPDEQTEVKRKLAYLNRAQKLMMDKPKGFVCDPERLTKAIQVIASEQGDQAPPHWATFWRWWTAFRATRCFSKLVDRRRRNHFKTDPVQYSVFEEVVNEVFLNKQRKPGKAVAEGVADRYARMNRSLPPDQQLKPPAKSTIYRWLNSLYRTVVDRAREGDSYTERELRIVTGTLKVKDILERWELDHTPLDVLVVCRITRMVLGRPWLTLVIDRKSRMIMGFYISFHAPSAYSVLYALRMAIRPKDELVGSIKGIRNPWPARGLPRKVVVDNGMDLHSDAVDLFGLETGIEIQFCPAAHPELKGAIERVFGTLSRDLFHQMPGTVFHYVDERRDYRQGGPAGFGLRRLLVDQTGARKAELARGEHKSLQTDRVVLVPGPQEEVQVVQSIYRWFVNDGLSETEIASRLNCSGIHTDLGREWNRATVHEVLINEKYIGSNVYNRVSFKLRKLRVVNPSDMWIRKEDAFPAIVAKEDFYTAQGIMRPSILGCAQTHRMA
ncbi:MAG: recombinase family protein [Comamonadaceae bacterium]|nr:recombinase family protein [Comamonadaceae bacterium]